MTRRLIETWLPIAALGEESVRERRSMTPVRRGDACDRLIID
jgi:adenine-specific DNA methylase